MLSDPIFLPLKMEYGNGLPSHPLSSFVYFVLKNRSDVLKLRFSTAPGSTFPCHTLSQSLHCGNILLFLGLRLFSMTSSVEWRTYKHKIIKASGSVLNFSQDSLLKMWLHWYLHALLCIQSQWSPSFIY